MIRRGVAGRHGRRRGAVAVVVALCLIPLIGVMAFAIDGGLLMATKRRAQTVADAAAHAAACQLYSNIATDPTGLDVKGTAKAAALANASANGFNNDGSTNTVAVNIPPKSGAFSNLPFYAEVIVTSKQSRYFSAILGSGTIAINARGVARGIVGGPTPYSNASIVALSSNKSGALSVTGGVNLSADSTVQIDSSSSSALTVNGGVNFSAPSIQVVGNYSIALGNNVRTTSDAAIKTAAPVVPDPLASLAAPDPSKLIVGTKTGTTLTPGVFSGGLTLGGGQNITMQPGLYYMKGGNFTVANGVNLSGTGVTIFLDSGSKLDLQGGTNVSMTPPTTGPWAGMSIFEDRTSPQPISLGNGANVNIGGTIYAPKAALSILGGSNVHAGSQVIVDSFSLSNGINLAFTTTSDAKKGYVASKTGSSSITIVE